jgi:hypothetical protein
MRRLELVGSRLEGSWAWTVVGSGSLRGRSDLGLGLPTRGDGVLPFLSKYLRCDQMCDQSERDRHRTHTWSRQYLSGFRAIVPS